MRIESSRWTIGSIFIVPVFWSRWPRGNQDRLRRVKSPYTIDLRTSVHDVEPSVSARAGNLRAALEPSLARACITQSTTEEGYKQSLMALKRKFGEKVVMRVGLTSLLLNLKPSAKAPRVRAAYASEVRTRLKDLYDIGQDDDTILEKLLSKLTEQDCMNWRMYQFGAGALVRRTTVNGSSFTFSHPSINLHRARRKRGIIFTGRTR